MSNERLTGYSLSRAWFDFAFENQGKVNSNHTAMYMWFIELKNRMGWAEQFYAPASQTMSAIGIKSYNTYIKTFNDLVSFKFIKLVKKSENQYQACVIALSNFDKSLDKSLDKSVTHHLINHLTNQKEYNKTINNKPKTNKQLTITPIGADDDTEKKISFILFWDLYDKKVGKKAVLEKKWDKLSLENQNLILAHIPKYKLSQPDKKFRKNPEAYLNNETWLDEIIETKNNYNASKAIQNRTVHSTANASNGRKEFGQL